MGVSDEKYLETSPTRTASVDNVYHTYVEKGTTTSQKALYANYASLSDAEHTHLRKSLLRKIDLRLLPLLSLMYLLMFLDKGNISQAKLGHLEKDLHMHGTDFNTAVSIYFSGYIIFQVPSNMLITRLRPSIYLTVVMALWGAISACQGAVHSYAGLVTARFFVGCMEAPFFPAAIFLLSRLVYEGGAGTFGLRGSIVEHS